MKIKMLSNGNLIIPVRVDSDGPQGQFGDTLKEITPEDPIYNQWLPFVTEKENSD